MNGWSGLLRQRLERAAAAAARQGVDPPPLRGKLLRPRAALAFVPRERRAALDDGFWLGCLAVQMAHEASLHHDDVLDGGAARRSAATLLATDGPGAALLAGDLCLTGSYRVAEMAGPRGFLAEFMAAVEATVRGERMQAGLVAAPHRAAAYEEVARAKSGALFGAAAALGAWNGAARGGGDPSSRGELREVGIELGAFYQMVDDFLDYCSSEETGKPAMQDFRNRAWTWVLGTRGGEWFDRTAGEAAAEFFRPGSCGRAGESMAERALARLEERGAELARRLRGAGGDGEIVGLVGGWIERCAGALREGGGAVSAGVGVRDGGGRAAAGARTAAASRGQASPSVAAGRIASRALALGPPSAWGRFFARNSRSFSFASLLFRAEERRMVRGIYAFCRFTDDLVDGGRALVDGRRAAADREAGRLHEALDIWTELAFAAYGGRATGIPLADSVMGGMARAGAPFELVSELIAGVRMDVEPRSYADMRELRVYTRRVASVVGEWMTIAFGVRDPWVLERARDLGHAMQLTNIVRDVGEDLAMGRVYLPRDRMTAHGVGAEGLRALQRRGRTGAGMGGMGAGAGMDPGYVALLEELMADADSAYASAYEGMPGLPTAFRRAVAVAAQVYRGIHDQVRANGHDNLNRRAVTPLTAKIALARQGLARLGGGAGGPKLADAR